MSSVKTKISVSIKNKHAKEQLLCPK